jgi:hypothetical protein
LAAYFENDVKNLPLKPNMTEPYFRFLETYGTHYASRIFMGAKAVHQSHVRTTLLENKPHQS